MQGPARANTVRVMLPHGMMVQGPIIDGGNELTGGWLLINFEQYDLAFEPPGASKGW